MVALSHYLIQIDVNLQTWFTDKGLPRNKENHSTPIFMVQSCVRALSLLRLQTIKTIVNSRRFKGSSCEEPRRVQVLDLYCLTRFESENSRRGDVY